MNQTQLTASWQNDTLPAGTYRLKITTGETVTDTYTGLYALGWDNHTDEQIKKVMRFVAPIKERLQ